MDSSTSLPTSDHLLTKHLSLETGDVRDAAVLLHQFNALSLGEGNLNAGANALAAMALTIANIAPSGSCLVGSDDDDGLSVSVGANLLVRGALSCSIIDDRVLALLQKLQGNVYAHIRQRLDRKKQGEDRITEFNLFANKGEEDRPPTVLDRLEKNSFMTDACFESEWRGLLRPPLDPEIGEITDAPVFFAGIGSEGGLDSAIGFANKGRLLVHTALTRKADAALLENVIREVVSGCPRRTLLAVGIKGEVIASDPHGTLDELLADRKDRGWLGRMLWLGDHADGPKFVIHGAADAMPGLRQIGDWFSLAVEDVAATRLNIHKSSPMELKLPMSGGQIRWNTFLLGLDPRFPGIAGTLRPLWASLVFGLYKIVSAAPADQRIQFSTKHVEALARVLALRMVHHREVVLEEGRRQFIEALAASFRLKLLEGPHTVRDLMRRSDKKIDADTAREALELLTYGGSTVCRGRAWQLASSTSSRALTLDA